MLLLACCLFCVIVSKSITLVCKPRLLCQVGLILAILAMGLF